MKPEDLTIGELLEMARTKDGIERLLTNYKPIWNDLMTELKKLNERVEMSGVIAKDLDLTGLDLSDVDIEDSDLSGSDLSNSDLSNAKFVNTNLKNSRFYDTNFNRTKITSSDLSGSRFYNANISGAYLTGSVDLFEADYKTSPEITKKGFRLTEAYEHEDEDYEDY